MTTTVTTHSSSARRTRISTLSSLATSVDSSSMSPKMCTSLPSSPVSVSGMSGLLNSRNLVQDEKLVVATLATLNSGSASNLIKQDLKWIIQSRRKAEGKAELQVEFKKPVRDEQLTSEELVKRARRRELNRLAARRSREKGQKRKDMLVEEIRKLQSQNSELVNVLGDLTEQRNNIVVTLRQHMKQCSDYHATQNAAVGMSQRVLDLLGFPAVSASEAQVQGVSDLYICTGDSSSSHSRSQSPSVIIKQEKYVFSSSTAPPLMVGISGHLVDIKPTPGPGDMLAFEDPCSLVSPTHYNLPSPLISYSIPMMSPKIEPPPTPLSSTGPRPHRSYTQGSEMFTVTGNSAPDVDGPDQEEVVLYKHKLMKHRKQFSDMTEPSATTGRGLRVSLERSFSFPSTVRESRSSLELSSPYLMELTHSDISTMSQAHTSATSSVLDNQQDCSLTQASSVSLWEKQFLTNSVDTWPPAGMRAAVSSRNLDRRWSVDDHQALPLNLSSKHITEEGHTLSPRESDSSGTPQRESQFSGFTVDPYR